MNEDTKDKRKIVVITIVVLTIVILLVLAYTKGKNEKEPSSTDETTNGTVQNTETLTPAEPSATTEVIAIISTEPAGNDTEPSGEVAEPSSVEPEVTEGTISGITEATMEPTSKVTSEATKKPAVTTAVTKTVTKTPTKEVSMKMYAKTAGPVQSTPNYYAGTEYGTLKVGTQYKVLETIQGTSYLWYKIDFGGKTGYAWATYFSETKPVIVTNTPTPTIKTGSFACKEMLALVNAERANLDNEEAAEYAPEGLKPYLDGDAALYELAKKRAKECDDNYHSAAYAKAETYAEQAAIVHEGSQGTEIVCWTHTLAPMVALNNWMTSTHGHRNVVLSDITESERVEEWEGTILAQDGNHYEPGEMVPGMTAYMACAYYRSSDGWYCWVVVRKILD